MYIGQYRVGKQLGAGSCANVFAGVDTRTGNPVAVKMTDAPGDETLIAEAQVYQKLRDKEGFPKYHWHGSTPDGGSTALIVDLLGTSLGGLVQGQGPLGKRSALLVAWKLLDSVEKLHRSHLLHRDIKPDNVLLGRGEKRGEIFIVDFGLAQAYVDEYTQAHVAYTDDAGFSGTPDFASLRTHHGVRQSRRDDLESIGYVAVYLLCGRLPWMGLGGDTEQEMFKRVSHRKANTPLDALCGGCDTFMKYLSYVRDLPYAAKPDYAWLKGLLSRALAKEGGRPGDRLEVMDPTPVGVGAVVSARL